MARILLILIILSTACLAQAEVLKLGRSVNDTTTELAHMKELGEYITTALKGDTYTSYKVLSDGMADNNEFIKLINDEKIDIVF